MDLCRQIVDVLVGICAISGFILGVANFKKAREKEHREAKQELARASQHLLKAMYRRVVGGAPMVVYELVVMNADTRPVTAVHVDFFSDAVMDEPEISRDCTSLAPNDELWVQRFGLGTPRYKSARIQYADASGYSHEYTQHSIAGVG